MAHVHKLQVGTQLESVECMGEMAEKPANYTPGCGVRTEYRVVNFPVRDCKPAA